VVVVSAAKRNLLLAKRLNRHWELLLLLLLLLLRTDTQTAASADKVSLLA
jgi:hypothetical protein